VYDHDPEDVDDLGWDEFIARQWESIFAGYRTGSGLRRTGRRWSDLLQAGLGCSEETADELVRNQIVARVDRDIEGVTDGLDVISGMYDVLADMRADLAGMVEEGLAAAGLLDDHARLLAAVHSYVFGKEPGVGLPGGEGVGLPSGGSAGLPDLGGAGLPDLGGAGSPGGGTGGK
jgi:hypothetical protein